MKTFALALLAAVTLAADTPFFPGLAGPHSIETATLTSSGKIQASQSLATDGSRQLTFTKTSPELRQLVFTLPVDRPLEPFSAYVIELEGVSIQKGLSLFPLILFHEKDGDAWYSSLRKPLPLGKSECQISLTAMKMPNYAKGGDRTLNWAEIDKITVGFLAHGTGQANLTIRQAFLSTVQVPLDSLFIPIPNPSGWTVTKDGRIHKSTLTSEPLVDGNDGLRLKFQFPTGTHMFYLPTLALPNEQYTDYKGVRVTLKGSLPKGISKLLILLNEQGGVFMNMPPYENSMDKWTTISIPFTAFTPADWAKKANGAPLDVNAVNSITIGLHGTASTEGDGSGELVYRSIEFYP